MAVFLINICKFNGCGIKFDSLGELITHIENIHIGKLIDSFIIIYLLHLDCISIRLSASLLIVECRLLYSPLFIYGMHMYIVCVHVIRMTSSYCCCIRRWRLAMQDVNYARMSKACLSIHTSATSKAFQMLKPVCSINHLKKYRCNRQNFVRSARSADMYMHGYKMKLEFIIIITSHERNIVAEF